MNKKEFHQLAMIINAASLAQTVEDNDTLVGYAIDIADNCSEPPRFSVSIFEWHKDHHDPVVCYCIDQNTTLDEFDNALSEL